MKTGTNRNQASRRHLDTFAESAVLDAPQNDEARRIVEPQRRALQPLP
jgi:hypothetical protein